MNQLDPVELNTELYLDILGLDHGFDLDYMEKTIIDDVMTEISINTTLPGEIKPATSMPPVVTVQQSDSPSCSSVIEATDVGSLLEQFEEASQSLDQWPVGAEISAKKQNVTKVPVLVKAESKKVLTSNEVVQKLQKSKPQKPKTAVMLPMMVPAKRGRGRAMTRGHPVAMPANCTPRRLQRVMMQNEGLKDSLALMEEQNLVVNQKVVILSADSAGNKADSTTNGQSEPRSLLTASTLAKLEASKPLSNDHDYISKSADSFSSTNDTNPSSAQDIKVADMEEGEVLDDDDYVEIDIKDSKCGKEKFMTEEEPGMIFDKLPSYYTALSIPRKQIKKTAACAYGRGGITMHDYIERAISPAHDSSSTYNKLPDYCSSFTNSTKYDSVIDSSVSKASSGYSSRSPSPISVCRTDSRSPSPCRSVSSHRSKSRTCMSRSRHPHNSDRHRQRSLSGCSGYTSSSSSCSLCCSRSSSCSSDKSCSTCDSGPSSSSGRSRSRSLSPSERQWKREQGLRSQRSKRQPHSRGRSYRRSRSRSCSYSRSRSRTYKSRSRSYSGSRKRRNASLERKQEERRKLKEEEKQQQMKERRIVYVGGLPSTYTRTQLRNMFSRFGEIENVQLHFREHGDNYGFVTFAFTCDAFAAIEKGNSIQGLENFDLCFGGRRQFCDVEYADLDGNKEIEEEYDSKPRKAVSCDFDELLRMAKAKIKK